MYTSTVVCPRCPLRCPCCQLRCSCCQLIYPCCHFHCPCCQLIYPCCQLQCPCCHLSCSYHRLIDPCCQLRCPRCQLKCSCGRVVYPRCQLRCPCCLSVVNSAVRNINSDARAVHPAFRVVISDVHAAPPRSGGKPQHRRVTHAKSARGHFKIGARPLQNRREAPTTSARGLPYIRERLDHTIIRAHEATKV